MVQSISASKIVNVIPGVVAAGGSNLLLNGLLLTDSTQVPIDTVASFGSADEVSAYFGAESDEHAAAIVYFKGYDNASKRPASYLIAQYNEADVAGYVRGGPGITLAEVQSVTAGNLVVIADGVSKTATGLNLSSATSLSNAAAAIQAAFTTPGFTVTYDSLSGAFVITSATTGAASEVSVTTGATATTLKLTTVTGLITSPGADAAVPGTFMDGIVALTRDWFCFTTIIEPSQADAEAFAAWNDTQDQDFAFSYWSTISADILAVQTVLDASNASGTVPSYAPINGLKMGAFVQSYFASLDYPTANARATLDKRSQSGLIADVTDDTTYTIMNNAGIGVYGAFGTAANDFTFYSDGRISGKFLWSDSYANQRLLNDSIQVAELTLMTAIGQIPYNEDGYGLIRQSLVGGPVADALAYGAIRTGVALTADQIAAINNAAGVDAATSVENEGFYLQILDPGGAARINRTTPAIKLWYADGQAVQQITISSLEVQ